MYTTAGCLGRRFFSTSTRVGHENPLVSVIPTPARVRFLEYAPNISRVFLDGGLLLRSRVKVDLFKSVPYQMSRKSWQLQVGKEESAKVQLQVSISYNLGLRNMLMETSSQPGVLISLT